MTGFIQLGANELSVDEREPSVGIPFTRTGDTSGEVTVEFRLDAETATAGSDFSAATGVILTATIPAGSSGIVVPISILDDALPEATETFTVSLVNVDSGTVLSPRTARVNILDDENPTVPPVEPPLVSDYSVSLETAIGGVNNPIDIEFSPVSATTAYVASKDGQIYAYDLDTGARLATVLDISAKVNDVQDRGLLDIALHPDFENNPYVYAFYVVDPPESAGLSGNAGLDGGGNRYAYLSRFTLDASTGYRSVVPDSEVVLVGRAATSITQISGNGAVDSTSVISAPASDIDPATGGYIDEYIKVDSRSHAGGSLAFGSDGKLYVGIGDGTSYNFADPRTISVQHVDSLSGKILRIDPLTGSGLADNPFYEAGDSLDSNSSKVYQLGLRNPFRMSFDETDRLFISETGWNTYEEINVGGPGANFGWPYYEGGDGGNSLRNNPYAAILTDSAAFYAAVANGSITITAPFRAFHHQNSQPGYQFNSIVGGDGYLDGPRYPDGLQNHLLFTDFNDGEVFSIDVNDRQDIAFLYKSASGAGPVQFVNGPDGFAYVVDLLAGTISRLVVEERPESDVVFRWAAGGTTVAAIDGGPDWSGTTAVVKGGPTSVSVSDVDALHSSVPDTTPLGLFARERWDPRAGAEMSLDFGAGVADGTYAVRLFLGNGYDPTGTPGKRVFDVLIEGALAFNDVDVAALFGHETGGMLEWRGTVTDGTIDIDFRHGIEDPLINGVEILRIDSAPPPPTVSLAVTPGTASEGAGTTLTVTVMASAPVDGAQSVALSLAGAGVTAGDFVGTLPSRLTIADGATSATLTLRVADDALVEGLETARFTISNPSSGLALGSTTGANVTIADNDVAPATVVFRWAAGGTAVAAIDGGPNWTAAASVVKGGPTRTSPSDVDSLHSSVPDTTPLGIFARERWDPRAGAEMGLDFGSGLADGTYAVRLFMGNGYDPTGTPGKRVFDVMIEGALAFDDVDIAARFGHETGGMLEWRGTVTDGRIDIDFRHGIEDPLINGVEILRISDTLLL